MIHLRRVKGHLHHPLPEKKTFDVPAASPEVRGHSFETQRNDQAPPELHRSKVMTLNQIGGEIFYRIKLRM